MEEILTPAMKEAISALGELIKADPRHLTIQEAIETYEKSEELNGLIAEYNTQQNLLSDLYGQNGADVDKDAQQTIQTRIDQLYDQITSHPVYAAYIEANGAPTVLSLRASASSLKAKGSEGNVLGEMLRAMGCVNIADSEDMLLEELSVETILTADPDYILVVRHGDDEAGTKAYVEQFFADHPAWSQLTAVKNGRVYYMDKTLFGLKPNHRWGEACEQLEELLLHE